MKSILTLTTIAVLALAACTPKAGPVYPQRVEDPQVLFQALEKSVKDYQHELAKFEGYLRSIVPTFLPLYYNKDKSLNQIGEQRKLQRELAAKFRVVMIALNTVTNHAQPALRYSLSKECPKGYEDKVMNLLLAKLRGTRLPDAQGTILSGIIPDPLTSLRTHPTSRRRVLGAFLTQVNLTVIGMADSHRRLRQSIISAPSS